MGTKDDEYDYLFKGDYAVFWKVMKNVSLVSLWKCIFCIGFIH